MSVSVGLLCLVKRKIYSNGLDGFCIKSSTQAKCLAYWWSTDLLATKSVEENVKKARRAFFHFGSIGAFQGDLSPLSTKSFIEVCVIPVLLYLWF